MVSQARPAGALSRPKKACFALVAVSLSLAFIELGSWLVILWMDHDAAATVRAEMELLSQGGTAIDNSAESIHPYLGWVMNPQVHPGTDFERRHVPVNALGFNDFEHGIPKCRPDRLILGICGGSVAWQMSIAGEETLVQKLREDPRYRDKEIQIIRLAMSGYKQPQQLLALNYLLALEAEFDVIVNIDGYNEVALAVGENGLNGIFVAYPRRWDARMQDVVDPRTYSVSYRLLALRATRQRLAAARVQSMLDWSPTLNLIWYLRNRRLNQQVIDLREELRDHKHNAGFGFPAQGPSQLNCCDEGAGENGIYRQAVDIWSRCSRQMYFLCRENGTRYLHILQPNQHLPDSKPLNDAERKLTRGDVNTRLRAAIPIGYPLLIDEGKLLREQGIAFHDLTMLFKPIQAQIYVDACCHYNRQGYEILANAVAERILEAD